MQWIIILLFISSCSGYRYSQQDNPLAQYGIRTLSVPMFYNFSNQPDVAGDFTRETYRLLTGFSGLKLSSGYDPMKDAVLVGIVKSNRKVSETLVANNLRVAKGRASNAIGDTRQSFNIPGATDVRLFLHVILIKKPTEEEMALLKSGLGDQIKMTSKVVFNVVLPVNGQYVREVFDRDNQGDPVNVVGTQNEGIRRRTNEDLAEQAAISIRDMILYAF